MNDHSFIFSERNYPNGDRRSFKADLRPITDAEPQFLRRFTADLRPECNNWRSFRAPDLRQFAANQRRLFALNQPWFDFGRESLGHKKIRTGPNPRSRSAPFHPKIRFIFWCQIPHFPYHVEFFDKTSQPLMHKLQINLGVRRAIIQ